MIVPKLPWLLLNSSTVSNLATRPHSIDGPSNTLCFFQFPEDPLFKTSYNECYLAMRLITIGDKINAPIYFSRDPKLGYELPHTWTYGTCVIEIDANPPDEGDVTTMVEISKSAIAISLLCLEEWPYLGGRQPVGENEVLMVFIYGRPVPDEKSPTQISRNLSIGDRGSVRKTSADLEEG